MYTPGQDTCEAKLERYLQQWVWWSIAAILFLLQLFTARYLPGIGQDEVQITDYGRLFMAPYSGWGATVLVGPNTPISLVTYLGPLINEVAYRWIQDPIAPRLAALIGGLLASHCTWRWLSCLSIPSKAAFLLSFALMLDPLFQRSQLQGRVDSWVFFFFFGGCWLLRTAVTATKIKWHKMLFLYGALASASLFIWPSAVFLWPLLITELWSCVQTRKTANCKGQFDSKYWLWLIAGAVLVCLACAAPLLVYRNKYFLDIQNILKYNVENSYGFKDKLKVFFSGHPWLKIAKALIKTFCIAMPLLALPSLLKKQNSLLIFATISCALMMAFTLIYEYRVLYLLPYFLYAGAGLWKEKKHKALSVFEERLNIGLLAFTLIWGLLICVGLRFLLAVTEGKERTNPEFLNKTTALIGSGNYEVFMGFTYELYLTGRKRGWHIYIPYIRYQYDAKGEFIRQNDYKPYSEYVTLLQKMDYAVFHAASVDPEQKAALAKAGMVLLHVANGSAKDNSSERLMLDHSGAVWHHYLRGIATYGPYHIYVKNMQLKTILPASVPFKQSSN